MSERAMLWDIGGVMVNFAREDTGRRSWQRRLGLPDGGLDQPLWTAIGSSGADDTPAIVDRLATDLGLERADAERLLHESNDHWHPNRRMIDLAVRMHRVGVPSAVVANAGAAARWAFEAIVDVHSFADHVVISAEVGYEKPDARIYLLASTALGVEPGTCVFVDDRPENVWGAAMLGMTAIHHVRDDVTIPAIEAEFAAVLGAPAR